MMDIWVGSFAATMSSVTQNSLEHVILVYLGFDFASLFLFETGSYYVVQVGRELATSLPLSMGVTGISCRERHSHTCLLMDGSVWTCFCQVAI